MILLSRPWTTQPHQAEQASASLVEVQEHLCLASRECSPSFLTCYIDHPHPFGGYLQTQPQTVARQEGKCCAPRTNWNIYIDDFSFWEVHLPYIKDTNMMLSVPNFGSQIGLLRATSAFLGWMSPIYILCRLGTSKARVPKTYVMPFYNPDSIFVHWLSLDQQHGAHRVFFVD